MLQGGWRVFSQCLCAKSRLLLLQRFGLFCHHICCCFHLLLSSLHLLICHFVGLHGNLQIIASELGLLISCLSVLQRCRCRGLHLLVGSLGLFISCLGVQTCGHSNLVHRSGLLIGNISKIGCRCGLLTGNFSKVTRCFGLLIDCFGSLQCSYHMVIGTLGFLIHDRHCMQLFVC